tara:strand:- start:1446 stop:2021 length:576 start_codon:yes stop_codon:yes gene_type:complete
MKNYFLLYHDEVKQGQEGVSFYYSDGKQKLYLRYARFQEGDISALVSSKHSKEKLEKLLAKPKDLWIFHCCGFQVLDSYFNRWEMQEVRGSHYQHSTDGKNWKDYSLGDNKKIDKLFEMHQFERDQCVSWTDAVDYELILKPHFQIRDITSIYRENVFNLAADFGSGTGEKSFPENYLRKLAFFNKFKTLH